ncbi:hypothetical protein TeGR_g6443 [Tetraparma gracilis]|uniref:Protein kinase domain-containing protein n=1 Tax=Tetraparma gracilis TaxID=2962635 RepID=A0ABQ6N9I5_9STRA|nr:hypothetical protein TeGR_g6443 [Tetraparma gracilis]
MPIPNSYDLASDIFLYHAEAAYTDSSTGASATLPCSVVYNANVPPTAALSVSCELTLATTYEVSIFHSRTNPQLLGGTQHVLEIEPAATDPDSCVVEFPSGKSIVSGFSFDAVVIPFDEFENPTNHTEDAFESRVELGSSGENVGDRRHVLPADHTFSELQTIAGSYKLYLNHSNTGREVADSPISFDVLPAPPSAATSTHAAERLKLVELEMVNQNEAFVRQKSMMLAEKENLAAEKEELEEEVRLKKHSEDELKVMVAALEAVSKERRDELKEVMMESKELKIDRLLGKGGFGVVNLATYRGTKVAMKQLLTVNEENVLRFRHECFLTKNLSHPNVVKLVGVCWSEELFACCLEFVENGSLEDWLRRTVGGKIYVKPKKLVVGKKNVKKKDPMWEVVSRGYDYNGKQYKPNLLTADDDAHVERILSLMTDGFAEARNPSSGGLKWKPVRNGVPLEEGVKCWSTYDSATTSGMAVATTEVKATPAQIMALYNDARYGSSGDLYNRNKVLEKNSTTRLDLLSLPPFFPGMHARECLTRAVIKKLDDGGVAFVAYTAGVDDERAPVVKGVKRITSDYGLLCKEKGGEAGVSELSVVIKTDLKLGGVVGLVGNSTIAGLGVDTAGDPVVKLKREVQKYLNEARRAEMTLGAPLAEAVFKGFDYNNKFDPKEHTTVDKEKEKEAGALLHDWWMGRMNPRFGWKPMLNADGTPLEDGAEGVHSYSETERCGKAVARLSIDATPAQVFGYYADPRTMAKTDVEVLDASYTVVTGLLPIKVGVATISEREALIRTVYTRNDQERSFSAVGWSVEVDERPATEGVVRVDALFYLLVRELPGSEGERSEVLRMTQVDPKFGTGLGFMNALAATKATEHAATPLFRLKKEVERLVKEYKPPPHVVEKLELTWKGGLWRMALEAALGVQYLHHHRYWSDGGKRHNGATNDVEEEEAGWKESVIHRDLKPDNMLLTRDWTLKLTDFGEARAQNMGGTMTSVGTPIYIAPEVMRADHYDEKADTWSYGLCLVAMIRAERTLEQFFYQALRKHKKRKTTKGLGMGQMTKYYYSEGWRPILPLSFVKAYPKLHALIQECWLVRRKERPNFDQIVARLQGDIGDEIKRKEEPEIELYSAEDDLVYRERIGKEDEIEDSDGEEEGTKRGDVVSKKEHDKIVAAKDRAMAELKETLREKSAKEREQGEVVGRWGAALENLREKHDVAVTSPEDLQALAATYKSVMKELEERRGREVELEEELGRYRDNEHK